MPSLHILNVGHGNSAVIADGQRATVIDAGPGADLLAFLVRTGLKTIDALILSHADRDHIAGAIAVLGSDEINIKSVYLNTNSQKGTDIWIDLLTALQDQHNRHKLIFEVGLTPHLNGRLNQGAVFVEVLAPSQFIAARGPGSKDLAGRTLTSNSVSAVIRITYHGTPVAMFPGDIDTVGLENLLENRNDVDAWLAVFPHHGGKPGPYDAGEFAIKFCSSVHPEIVVFSVSESEIGFPNVAVVEAVEATLSMSCMLTTRPCNTLREHIRKSKRDSHRDGVGNIWVDLDVAPLKVRYGATVDPSPPADVAQREGR